MSRRGRPLIATGLLGLVDAGKRLAHERDCFHCDLLRPSVHTPAGTFLHLPENCTKCATRLQVFGAPK